MVYYLVRHPCSDDGSPTVANEIGFLLKLIGKVSASLTKQGCPNALPEKAKYVYTRCFSEQ